MTFSFAAFDRATGQLGVVVQSKAFSVGSAVPWAMPGVGAVATQSFTNMQYGPDGLALLKEGLAPAEVIQRLTSPDSAAKVRQVGVVDAHGRAANYTGENCLSWAGGLTGDGWTAQGNILAGPQVVAAMAEAYTATEGTLADRLLAALAAGQEAGGDIRGMQSAAILVVGEGSGHPEGKILELRVEDHRTPIAELKRIYEVRKRVWAQWNGDWTDYTGDIVLVAEALMQKRKIASLQALASALGVSQAIRGGQVSKEFRQAILAEHRQ